jgi:hypothetical protein
MLRNATLVLSIFLVLGSSGLSTGALAHGGGYGSGGGGDGFRHNHFSGGLRGFRNSSSNGYRDYGNRGRVLGGGFRPDDGSDVWGRWGAYYGPMVPTI